MMQLLFGLLPIAATYGWYMGKQKGAVDDTPRVSPKVRHDYFRGLNYLINEQPDKAVDVFIRLLEVDSDTVETHLALGSLFRRRGEVERAIRIHQNLIARPNLPSQYRLQALCELGQDYLRAGVLDRAERLFLEVIALEGENQASYQFLLSIYQQEKDWHKAIEVARKLELLGQRMGVVISHFYCELAEEYRSKGQIDSEQSCLKKALQFHPGCVRALLSRAKAFSVSGENKSALSLYHKIIRLAPDFLPLTLGPLRECYAAQQQLDQWRGFLQNCLQQHPQVSVTVAMTQYLQHYQDITSATDFILAQTLREPSLQALKSLLTCYLSEQPRVTADPRLQQIDQVVSDMLAEEPSYQCLQCGFATKSLFWLCPSCHRWETLKPLYPREMT